jgi:hypothetical protein
MVAGTLAQAGYFMGDHLWLADDLNPKGFFEDWEINSINETILGSVIPPRRRILGYEFFRHRPLKDQRWLAALPVETKMPSSLEVIARIQKVTQRQPYCFKDPRFSYTLPLWRPYLENVIFVCPFRDPADTALSILKSCRVARHLSGELGYIRFSQRHALRTWTLMYQHILEKHRCQGDWLFLHYNQVLRGDGLDQLEKATGARVDHSFPDASLQRSNSSDRVPSQPRNIYERLCELAGYQETESNQV